MHEASHAATKAVTKLRTGVPGLDGITRGGFPEGRAVVIAGTAGSGKTVLAAQFLRGGIQASQSGVFVTCEESPANVRANVFGFGWDVAACEAGGAWAFVDASRDVRGTTLEAGAYDLTALMARIEAAVASVGASRVVWHHGPRDVDHADVLGRCSSNAKTRQRCCRNRQDVPGHRLHRRWGTPLTRSLGLARGPVWPSHATDSGAGG